MSKTIRQPIRPSTFDLARSRLGGFNLIDASAGTGKTYAICSLVLRLLLEKKLTIEQILVVTYTEAATEDLRDRIRHKLRLAADFINTEPDDPFLQSYIPLIQDRSGAARRISDALRSFDEAAIFTIHGFCQRMLLENSLETSTLFDTELVADDSYLIKEIAEDFWRRTFSRSSDLFSLYASEELAPAPLLDFLMPLTPHPFLRFIPDIAIEDGCSSMSDLENDFIVSYQTVCRAWPQARPSVSEDLLHSQALNRRTYNKTVVPRLINSMDGMSRANRPSLQLFDKFELLTASRITAATRKNEVPVMLEFYEYCQDLQQKKDLLRFQYNQCLLALKKQLFDSFRQELTVRKDRDNIFSFDDLLRNMHAALKGPGGELFAGNIARKYPAALIDEFQDTDPLQYEIFKTIYREKSLLFLIGDPKQAIYSFRGADIFTYMDAAKTTPLAHHTLGVNHRSTPQLVRAVNTLFCRARAPFIFDSIDFQPVAAARENNPEQFLMEGHQEAPFILWYVNGAPESGRDDQTAANRSRRLSKSGARQIIIPKVAAEIHRLLALADENRVCINERKLLPGDIAILVRRNDEARQMQRTLAAWRIPSVLHSGEDLFGAEEAMELSLLLNAIITPTHIPGIKKGLLTRFIGLSGDELTMLHGSSPHSEIFLEHWLVRFRSYHDLWYHHGFMRMFWEIMRENRVRQKLLAAENGERSLTNILHLAEILHGETVDQGLNMTGILGYLDEQLAEDGAKSDEHQLRLESDENRVKIVTIHKAKGLEYPVVFCPFTWEGSRLKLNSDCLFHRLKEDGGTELVLDAGSAARQVHLQSARREEMAENLRLLYVALTRAVHRCYLFWGPISGAESSAPAYLLHQDAVTARDQTLTQSAADNLMQQAAARYAGLSEPAILADLKNLATEASGTVTIRTGDDLPAAAVSYTPAEAMALACRRFSGTIGADWKISSFSSLITGRSAAGDAWLQLHDDTVDRDNLSSLHPPFAEYADNDGNRYDIFTFPRGAGPGSMLHELLEQADFTAEPMLPDHMIGDKLRLYGHDAAWRHVILHMLDNLAALRLHDNFPQMKLAAIPRTNCLHELEFYFPLARTTPAHLRSIFEAINDAGSLPVSWKSMKQQLGKLTFSPARGFMRGFIDLVFEYQGKFFLIDWKSNYLGPTIEGYNREVLQDTIVTGFYFLQYHLYCMALHLYLKERVANYRYEDHFGGVFYVFLRGINKKLGPGYGIFHDLPAPATIALIESELVTGKTGQDQLGSGTSQ